MGQITRDPIGKPRTVIIEVAGKEGAWMFPQKRGVRKISAEIAVSTVAGEPLRAAMNALAEWLDIETEAKLQISDDPGIYHMGVVETVSEAVEWNGLTQFTVTWACQPLAYGEDVSLENFSTLSNIPHVWDPGLLTVLYPVIDITPTDGNMSKFQLQVNGDTLHYNGSLIPSGETVTVNSIIPAVLSGVNNDVNLTGAYDPADLLLEYVQGSFHTLLPGQDNEVNFYLQTGTATDFDINVYYRERFRR